MTPACVRTTGSSNVCTAGVVLYEVVCLFLHGKIMLLRLTLNVAGSKLKKTFLVTQRPVKIVIRSQINVDSIVLQQQVLRTYHNPKNNKMCAYGYGALLHIRVYEHVHKYIYGIYGAHNVACLYFWFGSKRPFNSAEQEQTSKLKLVKYGRRDLHTFSSRSTLQKRSTIKLYE